LAIYRLVTAGWAFLIPITQPITMIAKPGFAKIADKR
jgi:hypothetical protein